MSRKNSITLYVPGVFLLYVCNLQVVVWRKGHAHKGMFLARTLKICYNDNMMDKFFKFIIIIFSLLFIVIPVVYAKDNRNELDDDDIMQVACLFEIYGENTCKNEAKIKKYSYYGYPDSWNTIFVKEDNKIKKYSYYGYPDSWSIIYTVN